MHRLLLAVFLSAFLSSCDSVKDEKVVITVHSLGNDMDSPKTIFRRNVRGQTMIFKIIPEVSSASISGIHSFPADDGSFGLAMKLDFKGTQSLDIVTRLRHGEILMSMVNGTVVDTVTIDRPISDGIFTIWRGFSPELIALLEEKYPPINELKSSSTFIEMTPSTRKEKKEARSHAEKAVKAKKEGVQARPKNQFDPEVPAGGAVPLSELLKD